MKILIVSSMKNAENIFLELITNSLIPPENYYFLIESNISPTIQSFFIRNFHSIYVRNFGFDEEVDTAIRQCKEWGPFDCILHTDEFSVSLAAEISDSQNGSDRLRNIIKFRDKVVMKMVYSLAVKTPEMYTFKQVLAGEVKFPLIIKPRSCAGSVGIHLAYSVDEVRHVFEKYQLEVNYTENDLKYLVKNFEKFEEAKCDDVEIEEFLMGTLYHIEGVVFRGRLLWTCASEFLTTNYQYKYEGLPLCSIKAPNSEQDFWREFVLKIHKESALPDGVFHIEACLKDNKTPYLIEIAIRPGGGGIQTAFIRTYGVNLMGLHIANQLGIPPNPIDLSAYFARVIFGAPETCSWLDEQQKKTFRTHSLFRRNYSTLNWVNLPQFNEPLTTKCSDHDSMLGTLIFCSTDRETIISDIRQLLVKR